MAARMPRNACCQAVGSSMKAKIGEKWERKRRLRQHLLTVHWHACGQQRPPGRRDYLLAAGEEIPREGRQAAELAVTAERLRKLGETALALRCGQG